MFSNVVVALKEKGQHAPLIELAQQAAAPSAHLHLVTLLRVGSDEDQEDEIARLRRAERELGRLAEEIGSQGYVATFEAGVVVVAAAFDLARIAGDRDADLMVIGLAKRSRVGKALMGSDAQRILLSSQCPVLVRRLYGS